MKKFLLFMSVCMLTFGQVLAQSQTISGTVLNAADDEPVIGASVQVKGTSRGTITDVDGKFSVARNTYVTNAEYAAESDNMTDLEDLLADLKDTFVK